MTERSEVRLARGSLAACGETGHPGTRRVRA